MAALADLSDLIHRATGGSNGTPQNVFWHKVPRTGVGVAATTHIAGRAATLWQYNGQPAGGSAPTVAEVCTNATVGALPFTNPGEGREAWLTQAWVTGSVGGTLILYDRLFHVGGLVSNITTEQTVQGSIPTPAITRNVEGEGNFAFVEINGQLGTTARMFNATYTNSEGVEDRVTTTILVGATGAREVSRALLLPLQAGDVGIRAIKSVQFEASTGTAGSFSVVIGKPLAYLGVGAPGAPGWRDYVTGMPGIPAVEPGACLALLWIPATTTTPELFGGYSIVEA